MDISSVLYMIKDKPSISTSVTKNINNYMLKISASRPKTRINGKDNKIEMKYRIDSFFSKLLSGIYWEV